MNSAITGSIDWTLSAKGRNLTPCESALKKCCLLKNGLVSIKERSIVDTFPWIKELVTYCLLKEQSMPHTLTFRTYKVEYARVNLYNITTPRL